MGNCSLGKCLPPYPGQTEARLKLGSGVGLSSITGCSFNLSLTRCIKNNGQQKWHPAISSSQSDSDTPTSYTSWVFALKKPALRTTEQVLTSLGSPTSLAWPHFPPRVLTSLGWPHFPPWVLTSLGCLHFSLLFPANKPCSLARSVHLVSWATSA